MIRGKLKKGGKWADQSFRYHINSWTASSARAHCKSHQGKFFEPAKPKKGEVMDTETRHMGDAELGLEQREEGQLPKIVGYAAVFDKPAKIWGYTEYIRHGAFVESIERDDVRALAHHDTAQLLGRTSAETLVLEERKKGLYMEITPPETTAGRDTVESIRRGDLSGASIGFRIVEDKWTHGEDEKENKRELLKIDLLEVSPVTFPAYEQTKVGLREMAIATGVTGEDLMTLMVRIREGLPLVDGDEQRINELLKTLSEAKPPTPRRDELQEFLRNCRA